MINWEQKPDDQWITKQRPAPIALATYPPAQRRALKAWFGFRDWLRWILCKRHQRRKGTHRA